MQKPTCKPMNAREIDELLRSAAPEPPLPAGFRCEVWSRIAHADQRSLAARFGRVAALFTRPVPAFASVAVTVLVSAWLGLATAPPAKSARLSYVESISPFLQQHTP